MTSRREGIARSVRRLVAAGWTATEAGRAAGLGRKAAEAAVDPQKMRARQITIAAIKRGDLERPDRCERCRAKTETQAHHFDYSRPLEVAFLCAKCHARRHMGPREISRPDPDLYRAIWAVARARQVTWPELLESCTLDEIVETYRGYLGRHRNPAEHTLAAADRRAAKAVKAVLRRSA